MHFAEFQEHLHQDSIDNNTYGETYIFLEDSDPAVIMGPEQEMMLASQSVGSDVLAQVT